MSLIEKPGLYTNPVVRAAYHDDPCPEPSLSRSIAKLIVERTPGHAKAAHPRLSPKPESERAEKFDLGSAAHAMLLGEGQEIEIIDADDWRTKEAKLKRDIAYGLGKIPLLRWQYDRASDMVEAVMMQLPAFGLHGLFSDKNGQSEVIGAWLDPVAGWCRFMADRLMGDLTIWDIKTTDMAVTPERLSRLMSSYGYEWQHAFYERGVEALYPQMRGRVTFHFLFIENRPPFAILPVNLSNAAIAKGRDNVKLACKLWARAKASGEWPLYHGDITTIEYPPWAIAEWTGDNE